jgi:hypothetical protein
VQKGDAAASTVSGDQQNQPKVVDNANGNLRQPKLTQTPRSILGTQRPTSPAHIVRQNQRIAQLHPVQS